MSVRKDRQRGTWYFVVDVPAANGSAQQIRRRGFPTKKAATDAMSAIVADSARGVFVRLSR